MASATALPTAVSPTGSCRPPTFAAPVATKRGYGPRQVAARQDRVRVAARDEVVRGPRAIARLSALGVVRSGFRHEAHVGVAAQQFPGRRRVARSVRDDHLQHAAVVLRQYGLEGGSPACRRRRARG